MSGSIGGNRIKREEVLPTLKQYINNVLKGFPGYKECTITGSFNAGVKKDHGDLDIVVFIEGDDLKTIKKEFKKYLDNLSDDVTVPFKDGLRKGQKSQLFGQIVTCGYPIYNSNEYVQVDNIIVDSRKKMEFQKFFLDLPAQKQALLMGLTRVIFPYICDENEISNLKLQENEEMEYVLSPQGISLRRVKLNNERKEESRVEVWREYDVKLLYHLLRFFDIDASYEVLVDQVALFFKEDKRAKDRILGLMKSVIKVGVGEVGTEKERIKVDSIKYIETTFSL